MRLFTVNAGMAAFVQGAPFILEPAEPRGKGVKEFLPRLAAIFVGKIAIRIDQRGDPTEQGSKIRSHAKMVDSPAMGINSSQYITTGIIRRSALESMNA